MKNEQTIHRYIMAGSRAKPLMTLEQEVAEIRARYAREREYNRQRMAARRLDKRVSNAISRDVMDESHG